MSYEIALKNRLYACVLDAALLSRLQEVLGKDGEFAWEAVVGTGGDLLGEVKEVEKRPHQIIKEWAELESLLASIPRIDRFTFTADIQDKGVVTFTFKNYAPADGWLVVSGNDKDWVEERLASVKTIFTERTDHSNARMYTRLGFGIIQTAIPLSVASISALFLAALIIPHGIRSNPNYTGFITAITLVVTLRLAFSVSNRLVKHVLKKYPYIRWGA